MLGCLVRNLQLLLSLEYLDRKTCLTRGLKKLILLASFVGSCGFLISFAISLAAASQFHLSEVRITTRLSSFILCYVLISHTFVVPLLILQPLLLFLLFRTPSIQLGN